jgi:hypothetical protein
MIEWVKLKWKERSRTYHFAEGKSLTVHNVVEVCVKSSGTHRLRTEDGRLWVIPAVWLGIELDCDEFTF